MPATSSAWPCRGSAIMPCKVSAKTQLEDRHAFSPILFSVRHIDPSPELQNMLAAVYSIDDDQAIPHSKQSL
jgi:hypothetical protein